MTPTRPETTLGGMTSRHQPHTATTGPEATTGNGRPPSVESIVATDPVRGRPIKIGEGFSALSFDHAQFDGLMDPLVMVDHFTMSEPTFGLHPHAGISAVSVLFEDSQGTYHNRDSLGHDIDLEPGDLYWLKAGRGVVHDESPRSGAKTHGLQLFVNLPAAAKQDAPDSLHVRADDMPELRGGGHRVRVVLGDSRGVQGPTSPALPLTILDVHLEADASFTQTLPTDVHTWIHTIRGAGQAIANDTVMPLGPSDAIAVGSDVKGTALTLRSEAGAQFALLQGQPIAEPIVQRGGFVMNTSEELDAVAAAHAAGELGRVD